MKKIFVFILTTVLFCTLFSVVAFATENESFKTGDANLDGVVNIKDATLIQKHIAGIATIDEKAIDLADADASGSVNVKDATLIQKFVAGIVTEFPEKNEENPTDTPTDVPSEESTTTPTEPTTEGSTAPPTEPPTDSEGYYEEVIRP